MATENILLVDDESAEMEMLKATLKNTNINIDYVQKASDAPNKISSSKYDLILWDFVMMVNGAMALKTMDIPDDCRIYIYTNMRKEFVQKEISKLNVKVSGIIEKGLTAKENLENLKLAGALNGTK